MNLHIPNRAWFAATRKDRPWELREDITVDKATPPMFFAHAFDDGVPVSNSVLLFTELKKAGVPAEFLFRLPP